MRGAPAPWRLPFDSTWAHGPFAGRVVPRRFPGMLPTQSLAGLALIGFVQVLLMLVLAARIIPRGQHRYATWREPIATLALLGLSIVIRLLGETTFVTKPLRWPAAAGAPPQPHQLLLTRCCPPRPKQSLAAGASTISTCTVAMACCWHCVSWRCLVLPCPQPSTCCTFGSPQTGTSQRSQWPCCCRCVGGPLPLARRGSLLGVFCLRAAQLSCGCALLAVADACCCRSSTSPNCRPCSTWPPSAAVLWAQPVPPACSGNQLACNNYPHVQGDQRLAVSGQLLCSVQGELCAAAVAASAQLAPATPSCCMPTWRTDLLLCPRPASPVCSEIPLSLPDLIVGPGATQDPLGQCLVVDTWLLVTAGLMLPIIHLYRAERRARRAFEMRQWEALGGREPQFAIEWPSWGWRDAFLGSALAWAILDALLVA